MLKTSISLFLIYFFYFTQLHLHFGHFFLDFQNRQLLERRDQYGGSEQVDRQRLQGRLNPEARQIEELVLNGQCQKQHPEPHHKAIQALPRQRLRDPKRESGALRTSK